LISFFAVWKGQHDKGAGRLRHGRRVKKRIRNANEQGEPRTIQHSGNAGHLD